MKTAARALALSVVTALVLTGCIRVEMNITLHEDDTASGEIVTAFSQDLLALGGDEALDELMNSDTSDIPGAVVEPYESEDEDGDGEPDYVGSVTSFEGIEIGEFTATGDGVTIYRDGDDFVIEGMTDDLTEETGGEDLGPDATATMSFTFPGEVIEADDSATVEGNTVTWDLLNPPAEIYARGSATGAGGGFPTWLIFVILGIVGIGIGITIVLITATRRKTADDGEPDAVAMGGEPEFEPAAAPAPEAPVMPAPEPTDAVVAEPAPAEEAPVAEPAAEPEPAAAEPAAEEPVADAPAEDTPADDAAPEADEAPEEPRES